MRTFNRFHRHLIILALLEGDYKLLRDPDYAVAMIELINEKLFTVVTHLGSTPANDRVMFLLTQAGEKLKDQFDNEWPEV